MRQKIKHSEKGYVLFYTLLMMTLILSCFFYLLNKLDLYKMIVESKKYTANTYLAAETLAIQQGKRLAGRFNKLSGYELMQEQDAFQVLSQGHEDYYNLYYTAKACLEITKSLFHTPSQDGYFYQRNQVKTKYMIQADRESQDLVLEVESWTYPYKVQDAQNPLKKDLVNLEKVKRALDKINQGLERYKKEIQVVEKQRILEELEPQFKFLQEELFTKPLYEVESVARIKRRFNTLSSQTVYLTLKLKNKARECPNKIDGQVYYFTLPYELELGYIKASKNSN